MDRSFGMIVLALAGAFLGMCGIGLTLWTSAKREAAMDARKHELEAEKRAEEEYRHAQESLAAPEIDVVPDEIEQLRQAVTEQAARIQALEVERTMLLAEVTQLKNASSATTPEDSNQKTGNAELDKKIRELAGKFDAAYRGKDAKATAEFFNQLVALGKDAWPEAARLLTQVAKDYDQGGNPLNLGQMQYYALWNDGGFLNYLITEPGVDPYVHIGAHYAMAYNPMMDSSGIFSERITRETDEELVRVMADALGQKHDDRAVPALIETLRREFQDPKTRHNLLMALAEYDTPEARAAVDEWARLASDEGTRAAAETARMLQSPPADGVVLLWLDENGVGRKNGLQQGDLITQINGQPMTGMNLFESLLKETTPEQALAVKVCRRGQFLDLHIPGGRWEVWGKAVKRK